MDTYHEGRLAEIFQSGMLFQREKEIVLWGDAQPGTFVTAEFCGENASENTPPFLSGGSKADEEGHFVIKLPPLSAGEGYQLLVTFHSPEPKTILLEHICFGDLWLAGGQSNMEFFLKYDRDWEETKKLPRNPKIRLYNVPQRAFEGHNTHNKTGYGYWFDDSDPALASFSAPAYSFARNVQASAGIPIGIIGCNWGGSTASAWVPEEVLRTPPLDRYLKEYEKAVSGISPEKLAEESLSAWEFEDSLQHAEDFEPLLYGRDRDWQLQYMKDHADDPVVPMGPYNINRPSGLYHTMLSSLIPFPIKGVLWYQGESDAGDYAFMYDQLLTALIKCWRGKWHDDFPFLIVQLAPFGVWLDCDNQGYAIVREKQAFTAGTVPDVYMAGIMDLGSYYDIHPKEKMEVGRRLALLARGHVYGEKNLLCDAPKAVRAVLQNDRQINITFQHGDGLHSGAGMSDWNIVLRKKALQSEIRPAGGGISDQNIALPEKALQPEDGQPPLQDVCLSKRDIGPGGIAIEDDHVILTLPDSVSDQWIPLSVSLGWDDYAEIYIANQAGLSALPFHLAIEQ